MKIKLLSLKLVNFKGIKNLEIPFEDQTNLHGRNESGKTTVFDSFIWVLFGKDSTDRKDFNIKTLDEHNQAIPKLPHEVEAILEIDGSPLTLKRCYEEKWTRRRGSEEAEFTGHESIFFIDGVPVQAQEYKAKISSIVDEGLFKLLTNALYFNGLDWSKRREILTSIAGEISDRDIAGTRKEFILLLASLNGLTLEKFKAKIAAQKKTIKDQLVNIPSRIDEVVRSIPEAEDYVAIGKEIADKNGEIVKIDRLISDKAEAHKVELKAIQDRQDLIHELKTQLQKREFEIKTENSTYGNDYQQKVNELYQEMTNLNAEKRSLERPATIAQSHINNVDVKLVQLRKDFTTENAKEFAMDLSLSVCPTCKRPFENAAEKESEMKAHFNEEKARKLEEINKTGLQYKADKEGYQKELDDLKEKEENLDAKIKELNLTIQKAEEDRPVPIAIETIITADTAWKDLKFMIDTKEAELLEVPKLDVSAMTTDKLRINGELDVLKAKLAVKETIEKQTARKEELLKEEKKLSQELSLLEGQEFIADEFTRAKVGIIEDRISSKFKYARFKMYDQQINGGMSETCVTLYKGIPWNDLNSAGKVLVGLDIVNTLSEFHDTYCPCFLDNREGVTSIPDTKCQIVNLFVDPAYDVLTIK